MHCFLLELIALIALLALLALLAFVAALLARPHRPMAFLFHFSAIAVLPFWMAMIAFPRAALTRRMVRSVWIILPPVVCYLALAAPHVGELAVVFAAPSPASLARVMGEPWAASMFWAYAGAFDLFVGRWIFFDAMERGIRHRWVAPALAVAIFFGPVGFSLYALVRAAHARRSPERPSSP